VIRFCILDFLSLKDSEIDYRIWSEISSKFSHDGYLRIIRPEIKIYQY